jgi:hypothetical protein
MNVIIGFVALIVYWIRSLSEYFVSVPISGGELNGLSDLGSSLFLRVF